VARALLCATGSTEGPSLALRNWLNASHTGFTSFTSFVGINGLISLISLTGLAGRIGIGGECS
jgi:hypothetical protein